MDGGCVGGGFFKVDGFLNGIEQLAEPFGEGFDLGADGVGAKGVIASVAGEVGDDDVVLGRECLSDAAIGHGVGHQTVKHDEWLGVVPACFEPVEGVFEVGVCAVNGAQGEVVVRVVEWGLRWGSV